MRVHFVGINGVSMQFLASLCRARGVEVSGSDISTGGHKASNVTGADAVVYSYAISADNVEIVEAKRLGIPLFSRAELLGELSNKYGEVVAISGTHGKTTTTAMMAAALRYLNPTCHVGGSVNGVFGNIGEDSLFITEACEYRESFLSLAPDCAVVLNVELDHADYYGSYQRFYAAFEKFTAKSKTALVCGDNEAKTLRGMERTYTFGLSPINDYYAHIVGELNGYYTFEAYFRGEKFADITLSVRGEHNVLNAMSVIAYCHLTGKDFRFIGDFTGVDRRFESLCKIGNTEIISDYAHHPHEIECTLELAKKIYRSVFVVFEPHTYTRTAAFCKEFASALSIADECLLLPIYPAREAPIPGVDSSLIANKGGFMEAQSYSEAQKILARNIGEYDCVLFMGAGTVDDFARRFVSACTHL
ncbi:MAG: UDP-N-acetylmuramate--L-alanine ligase [Clostridiales bacterium]|nr:UDP-N-acetylmuramate--L-alanine ligase [Clostridiales bacterium]